MKKEPFEINVPFGYTPDSETLTLRRAVSRFNQKKYRNALPGIGNREQAAGLVGIYEAKRGAQLKRSRLNF